jgi:hypothetical protein
MGKEIYRWSARDRLVHLLPAIPLFIFYAATIFLLARHAALLAFLFFVSWIGTNLAAVRICAGCPYRGGYCPGLCQLFVAPFFSLAIFPRGRKPAAVRSFTPDVLMIGLFGLGGYLFAFYWLIVLYGAEYPVGVAALAGLLLLYMGLSFFLLCPKCGYNDICPMSRVHKTFK